MTDKDELADLAFLSTDPDEGIGIYIDQSVADEDFEGVIPWDISIGDLAGMPSEMASRYIPLVEDLLDRLRDIANEMSKSKNSDSARAQECGYVKSRANGEEPGFHDRIAIFVETSNGGHWTMTHGHAVRKKSGWNFWVLLPQLPTTSV